MRKNRNDLEKYFRRNTERIIDKWDHYFDIYDSHFKKFRRKSIVILEIGVAHGGSLQMWKKYFGKNVQIYGIDIDPRCKEIEEKNIKIFIGSQANRNFLREIKQKIPKVDILIDDGGHTMEQQITTFEELFDHVKSDGVYLIEDLHTSYWKKFGGGYKQNNTFIEYSKNFIDYLNAYHSKEEDLQINSFTNSVNSIHYYDSVLVIEKREKEKPSHKRTGMISIENPNQKINFLQKLQFRFKQKESFLLKPMKFFFKFFSN